VAGHLCRMTRGQRVHTSSQHLYLYGSFNVKLFDSLLSLFKAHLQQPERHGTRLLLYSPEWCFIQPFSIINSIRKPVTLSKVHSIKDWTVVIFLEKKAICRHKYKLLDRPLE